MVLDIFLNIFVVRTMRLLLTSLQDIQILPSDQNLLLVPLQNRRHLLFLQGESFLPITPLLLCLFLDLHHKLPVVVLDFAFVDPF